MEFKLLKNQSDFEAWKGGNIFSDDAADPPKEFPCYATTVVFSWTEQKSEAEYLYYDDIEKMLLAMGEDDYANNPTVSK